MTKPVTSPVSGSLPGGPCRAGTAVTRRPVPSGRSRSKDVQGTSPVTRPPSRTAPDGVVRHLGDEITVDDLAQRAHLSRRSFDRHFRQATGTSPPVAVAPKNAGSAAPAGRHRPA